MHDRFRQYASRRGLWSPGDRILLAVSGGVDSMVMLDLFRAEPVQLVVAHANFRLRDAESDADEAFVKAYCERHKILFFSRSFDTKKYAEAGGLSTQMAARELRYAWFEEILTMEKCHFLATAHHLNDSLETVLLRWAKGGDIHQMSGIRTRFQNRIRPMLFATREEIVAYANENSIQWREDSSNASDDYFRNFIRHRVVPLLREMNPSIESTFSRSVEKLQGAEELMVRGLEQLKDQVVSWEGDTYCLDLDVLRLLRHPSTFLYECLAPYGFDWDTCFRLSESLDQQPGTRFLSETHQAVIDREKIFVTSRLDWQADLLLEEGQDKAALGPWQMAVNRSRDTSFGKDPFEAVVDAAHLRFPLRWRRWAPGDYMVPLGLGHRKKVSDLLIDMKVPLQVKSSVTVLLSQDEVVWLVGYRIDDRYKVTPETREVVRFSLRRIPAAG